MKKGTKVILVSGERHETFSTEEAEWLLTHPKNNGHWALTPNSKFSLQDGKIISNANPGTTPRP